MARDSSGFQLIRIGCAVSSPEHSTPFTGTQNGRAARIRSDEEKAEMEPELPIL